MGKIMDEQRQLIADFNEALMESQIDHDQHYQNERSRNNVLRGEGRCTQCTAKLYRGHFHVIEGNNSVCCTCVPKIRPSRGVKTLQSTITATRIRNKATMKARK